MPKENPLKHAPIYHTTKNELLIFWLGSYLEWQKNDLFFGEKGCIFLGITIFSTDKQLKRLLEINYPNTRTKLRGIEFLTFYLNYGYHIIASANFLSKCLWFCGPSPVTHVLEAWTPIKATNGTKGEDNYGSEKQWTGRERSLWVSK